VTKRINLVVNGKVIAYSVPLFGSICEAQIGTEETVYDFAEMGKEDMRGCGRLWHV